MKTKLIQALEDYYAGKEVTTFGGAKSAIEHHLGFNKLKRIWNDGRGLISFAQKDDDGVLLINKLFCSKKEIKDITENLKVPFEFVNLGYPDYYTKGLSEMRHKNHQP